MPLWTKKIITIFGTQKVGKTTLFRQLIKQYSRAEKGLKSSPVINHVESLIRLKNNIYKLIDTPYFQLRPLTEIGREQKKQTEELLKKSDLILWLVVKINDETLLLNKYLRKFPPPQILVLNKIDLVASQENFPSCRILHPKNFITLSAEKAINVDKLVQQIITLIPAPFTEELSTEKNKLSLLIFGPPNSGKSTLMNYLLRENRSLITPVAGTTQEPVISQWNCKKINFQLVDTAGITKEQKLKTSLWKNCDLVWAVIDANLPLNKQILQVIHLGEKHCKPLFIIINKCDLISDKKPVITELRNRLKSLNYCPIIALSAWKETGISSLIECLNKALQGAEKKISKKEISAAIEKMIFSNPPPYYKGNKLKIYFAKQEAGLIPHFIFFVNNPQWVHFSYQRYITNCLRSSFDLKYLPIKITWKKSV